MIKKYNQFINEGLNQFLTGPSDEEVKRNITKEFKDGKIDIAKYIICCEKFNMEYPTIEEIRKNYYFINTQDLLNQSIINNTKYGVKIALELGADIDFLGIPIWYAITYHKYNMLKHLVELGANVNIMNGKPLICAVTHGTINDVKYLLKMGADKHNAVALFYAETSDKPTKYKLIKDYADKTPPLSDEEKYIKYGYYKMKPGDLLLNSSENGFLYGVKKAFELGVGDNTTAVYHSFRIACRMNKEDVIRYFIIERDLDLTKIDKKELDSTLEYASTEIKELVKSKLNNDKEI